jgi:uncharacterized membrane protein YkvA (DUF1232 family)
MHVWLSLKDRWRGAAERLKTETYTLYLAYRDPRVPWYARLLTGLILAYAFSPIDLIPDFIPVVGYLDDLVIVPLGIALALKMIPPEVMIDARQKALDTIRTGKPMRWAGMGIILMIWLIGLALAVWIFYRICW